MIIKDWWYAYKVCKKYKLRWIPFIKLEGGCYNDEGYVRVNPFSRNFMSIFMHEIGHYVHDKRIGLISFLEADKGELHYSEGNQARRSIYKTLESEATASRFAIKTSKGDRQHLIKAYNTYSASIFKNTTKPVVVNEISKIVDCVYKNSRRIEK